MKNENHIVENVIATKMALRTVLVCATIVYAAGFLFAVHIHTRFLEELMITESVIASLCICAALKYM